MKFGQTSKNKLLILFDFSKGRAAFSSRDMEMLGVALGVPVDMPTTLQTIMQSVIFWPERAVDASSVGVPLAGCRATAAQRLRDVYIPIHGMLSAPTTTAEFADIRGLDGWTIEQFLTRLALDRLKPRKRVAVVGTMRDDGIYVLEWISHYRALGFEHIFIYTNDNADGSDGLLSCLAAHGIVTVIDNVLVQGIAPEAKAFGHALNLLPALRDFEWTLFIDSDEFLALAPGYGNSIVAVLDDLASRYPNGDVAGISYDWLWFVSDNAFERKPGLLLERFQHARPHWLAKCLVRVRDVLSMRRRHWPELVPGFRFVDSAFQPLDETFMPLRKTAEYSGGRLNHYWPKSFQEFAVKKARGASLGGVRGAAERIERGFPNLLRNVCDSARLRQIYQQHREPAGPL